MHTYEIHYSPLRMAKIKTKNRGYQVLTETWNSWNSLGRFWWGYNMHKAVENN